MPVFWKNNINNIKNKIANPKNRSLPKNLNSKFINPKMNPYLIKNNKNNQLINNKKQRQNSYISIMEEKIRLKKKSKGKK